MKQAATRGEWTMLRNTTLAAGLAAVSILAASAAQAEYVAYAVTDDGRHPLPERLDDVDAQALINVEWGPYGGPQERVAVLKVENESQQRAISVSYGGQEVSAEVATKGVPVNGIEAMMTDALFRSGRFRVMERQKVDKVLKEQDFGASGRVSNASAAKIGKVLGAETLVQAVVTHYAPDFEGQGGSLGGITDGLLGGLSISSKKSLVGMNFRMFNAETGEIIFTQQVKAVVGDTSFGFGAIGWGSDGAAGGAFNSFSKTPIGRAVIACVNKGVYELVKEIGAQPPSGKIVKVEGNQVYVNIGGGAVSAGDSMTVVALGEELVDPETGISLGQTETNVAKLKVAKTTEQFSIATVASKNGNFGRGDKVVADKMPEPLQYAGNWDGPSASSGGSGGGGGSSNPKQR